MEIQDIKRYMKEHKITYNDLAEKTGLSLSTITKIFGGYAKYPRVDTMQSIEHALGLDEKKPLADSIIEQVDELNLHGYNDLSDEDKKKIAEIFNASVSAFKKK